MILGGDLGGTKTLLALADFRDGQLQIAFERRYASQDYPTFDALLEDFLADAPPIRAACFGVAGPTDGLQVKLTYLPWEISTAHLASRFKLRDVLLANDFAAAANGLPLLARHQLKTLQAGQPVNMAPRVILGAGTGLGVAGMVWAGNRYCVIPGEGGHIGLAPQTPEQAELWRWLYARNGRVTTEDVVCGAGLARIYAFLAGRPHPDDDPGAPHTPAEIGGRALNNSDPLAQQAVELWFSVYGAFAGDLAIQWLAYGGVYLAGGMAAKLMPHIGYGAFMEAFNAKREHRAVAEKMPIHLVTDERLGLLGALALADQRETD
jgi:glucokinase